MEMSFVPMDFSQKPPSIEKKPRKYTQKSVASQYEASLDPKMLKNLFNNMPGYTIGAVIELVEDVTYN